MAEDIVIEIQKIIDFVEAPINVLIPKDNPDPILKQANPSYEICTFTKDKLEDDPTLFNTKEQYNAVLEENLKVITRYFELISSLNIFEILPFIDDWQSKLDYQTKILNYPQSKRDHIKIHFTPIVFEYDSSKDKILTTSKTVDNLSGIQTMRLHETIEKINSIEHTHLRKLLSLLEEYNTTHIIKLKFPLKYPNTDKLKRIASILNDVNFISDASVQPFIDTFSGKTPSQPIRWTKETTTFVMFINSFREELIPLDKKKWVYFQNTPLFLDETGKQFVNLAQSYQIALGESRQRKNRNHDDLALVIALI
ncbi:MAG: hypothetical protein RBR68_01930 [Tenuifilaceae bacterium]|jgi:hypothetical protein|nr:hypothetical protein [Tenuifilaceae bacterium]